MTLKEPLPAGTLLNDRYQIIKVIGSGGFSWVYLAKEVLPHQDFHQITDKKTRIRRFIVKECFPHDFISRKTRFVEVEPRKDGQIREVMRKFKNEAFLLASFQKTGYPQIENCFWQDGLPYIVMPYYPGMSVLDILNRHRKKITLQDVLVGFKSLLLSVQGLHRENLLHLDIHPGNIYYTLDGKVLLLDFGSILHRWDKHLFSSHVRVVTEGYSAPEVMNGGANIGPWSDIYMLGACLRLVYDYAPITFPDWLKQMMLYMLEEDVGNRVDKIAFLLEEMDRNTPAVTKTKQEFLLL